jgi:serine/threonine-protein kinase HSL1 (negative regulator of Swe1 kinase)
LLVRYREAQLENYTPELEYSDSDHHHARPLAKTKKLSTRNFTQPKSKGHSRQISRFTVISNVSKGYRPGDEIRYAETDAGETVKSYDPFRASRPQNLVPNAGANISHVIIRQEHQGMVQGSIRNGAVARMRDKPVAVRMPSRASVASSTNKNRSLAPPAKVFASRSSIASSTRSRGSARTRAPIGHRRGISFSHIRKQSNSNKRNFSAPAKPRNSERHSRYSEVTDDDGDIIRAISSADESKRYPRSRKPRAPPQHTSRSAGPSRTSPPWNEDVRKLSSSLANACDEAFNRSSVASAAKARHSARERAHSHYETPMSPHTYEKPTEVERPIVSNPSLRADKSRPLPPPPTRSESVNKELFEARHQAQQRKRSGGIEGSPGYLDRMVSHIDRLIQPGASPQRIPEDRRVASAPLPPRTIETHNPLPSINELNVDAAQIDPDYDFRQFIKRQNEKDLKINRHISAPESRHTHHNRLEERASRQRQMHRIRIVDESIQSPAKCPAPLNIRKKASIGGHSAAMSGGLGDYATQDSATNYDLHQQYIDSGEAVSPIDLSRIDEDHDKDESTGLIKSVDVVRKKPSTWFKRGRGSEDDKVSETTQSKSSYSPQMADDYPRYGISPLAVVPKKKGFGFGKLFKRKGSKQEKEMVIGCKLLLLWFFTSMSNSKTQSTSTKIPHISVNRFLSRTALQ